jgi:hypothetical protein
MVYVCVHLGMGAQIAHQLLVTQIAWLVNAMVPPLLIVIIKINLKNKKNFYFLKKGALCDSTTKLFS